MNDNVDTDNSPENSSFKVVPCITQLGTIKFDHEEGTEKS